MLLRQREGKELNNSIIFKRKKKCFKKSSNVWSFNRYLTVDVTVLGRAFGVENLASYSYVTDAQTQVHVGEGIRVTGGAMPDLGSCSC